MEWNVEHTDEFAAWWHELDDGEQEDITATALLLMEHGPQLPFPHSSGAEGSRHGHMRELRVQSRGIRSGCSTPSIRGGRQSC